MVQNERSLNDEGKLNHDRGDYNKAIECYEESIKIDPEDFEAWNGKGRALRNLDRNDEALMCCERALAINGEYKFALLNKASILNHLKRHEEAIEFCNQVIAIHGDCKEAFLCLGDALRMVGRNQEAINYFDRAISIKEDYADALHGKGCALQQLGKNEDAIKCFDDAIHANRRHRGKKYSFVMKGIALRDLGRIDESIDCFNQAIAIHGSFEIAHVEKELSQRLLFHSSKVFDKYVDTVLSSNEGTSSTFPILSDCTLCVGEAFGLRVCFPLQLFFVAQRSTFFQKFRGREVLLVSCFFLVTLERFVRDEVCFLFVLESLRHVICFHHHLFLYARSWRDSLSKVLPTTYHGSPYSTLVDGGICPFA